MNHSYKAIDGCLKDLEAELNRLAQQKYKVIHIIPGFEGANSYYRPVILLLREENK